MGLGRVDGHGRARRGALAPYGAAGAYVSARTQGWPLGSFTTAVSIAGAYLAFVLVGSVTLLPASVLPTAAERRSGPSTPRAPRPAQLVMRALPGDGIKLYGVAFLYNIAQVGAPSLPPWRCALPLLREARRREASQVMLCSYMCIEATIVARRSVRFPRPRPRPRARLAALPTPV